jgi:Ca-activated chloride channel family protein
VLVPVDVSDPLNRPVSGLEKSNFHVFDQKVEQTIVPFAMEDDPIAVGLVLDTSGSMGEENRNPASPLTSSSKTANPGDEFCLVAFDSAPRRWSLLPRPPRNRLPAMFTNNRAALLR